MWTWRKLSFQKEFQRANWAQTQSEVWELLTGGCTYTLFLKKTETLWSLSGYLSVSTAKVNGPIFPLGPDWWTMTCSQIWTQPIRTEYTCIPLLHSWSGNTGGNSLYVGQPLSLFLQSSFSFCREQFIFLVC